MLNIYNDYPPTLAYWTKMEDTAVSFSFIDVRHMRYFLIYDLVINNDK